MPGGGDDAPAAAPQAGRGILPAEIPGLAMTTRAVSYAKFCQKLKSTWPPRARAAPLVVARQHGEPAVAFSLAEYELRRDPASALRPG